MDEHKEPHSKCYFEIEEGAAPLNRTHQACLDLLLEGTTRYVMNDPIIKSPYSWKAFRNIRGERVVVIGKWDHVSFIFSLWFYYEGHVADTEETISEFIRLFKLTNHWNPARDDDEGLAAYRRRVKMERFIIAVSWQANTLLATHGLTLLDLFQRGVIKNWMDY